MTQLEICVDVWKYNRTKKEKNVKFLLSNYDDSCLFTYKGQVFRTIEHALQFAKCSLFHPSLAHQFAVSSNSKLAFGSGADAWLYGTKIVYTKMEKETWQDAYISYLADVTAEKYAQNLDKQVCTVLCATLDAELWFKETRKGVPHARTRAFYLEEIRDSIRPVMAVFNYCFSE